MLSCGNQHHCLDDLHLKAFLWSCLPSKGSAQDCLLDCLLAEDLSCDQSTPVCYGRLGDDTVISCEEKVLVGVSILHLICWQGLEDGNKGVFAEIPKPEGATPKRADSSTLDLSCHSKES